MDPALVERGLRGHAATQNALARHIIALHNEPLSPAFEEPAFDLAWKAGDTVFVAEIKSRTDANEERQLRLGLGQVLPYRHLLSRRFSNVQAVFVLEYAPPAT